MPLPSRRRPIHGVVEPFNRPVIVFDTVCVRDRAPVLARPEIHQLLCDIWRQADGWLVGRYVVMPDHLHYFCAPGRMDVSLEGWTRYWKSQFNRRAKEALGQRRAVPWQSDHWDTRMRTADAYEEKWAYVRANPVRAGLVTVPEEWPFQGVLHELRWD